MYENKECPLFAFNLTTCDVMRLVKMIKVSTDALFIIEFIEIMNKSKVVLLVKEYFTLVYASVEHVDKLPFRPHMT